MPTYTTLHQDATTLYDGLGAAKFRIVSSIAYAKLGDLPLTPGTTIAEIFVHSIVDVTDPKQDKFLRVADIHDLTLIVRGRDNAIAALETTYLAPAFTVEFNDVTTAAAAKLVVQTRVDELIADWIKYTTEFLVPVDFPMPAPVSTLVVAAKAAFKKAQSNSAAAEAALATANAASLEAVAAAGRASTAYVSALTDTNTCNTLATNAAALQAAYTSYSDTMNGFVGVVDVESPTGNGPIDAAFPTALAAKNNELASVQAVMTLVVNQITSECAAATAAVTTAATAKATADGTVATTQTAQTQAQATATAAATAEAAALAAVLLVCADFDPNA